MNRQPERGNKTAVLIFPHLPALCVDQEGSSKVPWGKFQWLIALWTVCQWEPGHFPPCPTPPILPVPFHISYYISVVDCSMDSLPMGTRSLPSMSDTTNLAGTMFTFECLDGYDVIGCSETGDQTFVCKENGKWSLGSLYCQGLLFL